VKAAPVGTEVGIYVDCRDQVDVDDLIVTTSGRTYLVVGVRVQQKGKNAGRQHLRAVVLDETDARALGASRTRHIIRWYERGTKRRR
jgi:hypothetical protein